MPIYEYECSKCHHQLEMIQKFSDPPALHCPECSSDSLVRLVSAAGFQLKGSGWYVTDFKDKKPSTQHPDSSQGSNSNTTESKPQTSEKKIENAGVTKKEEGK